MRSKAASRSRSLASFTGTICRPRARAAVSTTSISNVVSGSSRTATTLILGTSSCNNASRFAPSRLPPKNVTPVRLPSGRLRLATRPIFTDDEHERYGRAGNPHRRQHRRRVADDHGRLPADQIGGEARQPIRLIVSPALLDDDIASFDESFLTQPFAEFRHEMRKRRGDRVAKKPNH